METVIHPDIKADETLRPLVERANADLERWSLRGPKPDMAVWWKDADEFGQPLVRLEFRWSGDSLSHRFKPEKLDGSFVMEGEFSSLRSRMTGRRIDAISERILTHLREWREELEAEEEAATRSQPTTQVAEAI